MRKLFLWGDSLSSLYLFTYLILIVRGTFFCNTRLQDSPQIAIDGGIALRPITAMLGVSPQSGNILDVPEIFDEFIKQNSGCELSYLPVNEYTRHVKVMKFISNVLRICVLITSQTKMRIY